MSAALIDLHAYQLDRLARRVMQTLAREGLSEGEVARLVRIALEALEQPSLLPRRCPSTARHRERAHNPKRLRHIMAREHLSA